PPDAPIAHPRLVAALRIARKSGDSSAAARAQAELAHEGFAAAELTTRTWVGLQTKYKGWLPRSLRPNQLQLFWNYADVAADCYPHLVIAAHLVAPDLLPVLTDMLARERAISPPFSAI